MGALVTNFTTSLLGGYFTYAAFAIAISALTILTVPVLCVLRPPDTRNTVTYDLRRIVLSISRKGAFPSMVVVELSYLGTFFPHHLNRWSIPTLLC
jgi:predicted MFS family arabinose efflux permease